MWTQTKNYPLPELIYQFHGAQGAPLHRAKKPVGRTRLQWEFFITMVPASILPPNFSSQGTSRLT